MTTSCAPSRIASSVLLGEVVNSDDLRAERAGELHAHVPQAAQAHDPDLLAGAHLPVTHRGIRGDAGAEQGRGGRQVQVPGSAARSSDRPRFCWSNRRSVAAGVGSRPLYVKVLFRSTAPGPLRGSSGRCGTESTRQPTPAISPTLNPYLGPTAVTSPTISWPATMDTWSLPTRSGLRAGPSDRCRSTGSRSGRPAGPAHGA